MKKIGNYQLIAELKRGAHSATYRGWDAQNQRVVLLKTFPARTKNDSPRFAREAQAYSRIVHPNIVRLWDYGFADSVCYLALEFIEGQDLRRVLQQNGALPAEIATALLYEALRGLAEIHQQNIIHRDLKPENLLPSQNGEVKLCDFDLALPEETATSSAGLTGSPGYVAPEIILGERPTPRADIFSLGVVFYEMLAGTRPFQAATTSGEMNAIVRLAHLPLNKLTQATPAPLEEFIAQMLAKRANERCASALFAQQWLEKHFAVDTPENRMQLLRRYLAAPGQYQTTGLLARAQAVPELRISAKRKVWPYLGGFVGMLILSLVLFYAPTRRDSRINTPAALLELGRAAADTSSNEPTPDSSRTIKENVSSPFSAREADVNRVAKRESTALSDAPAPLVRTIFIRSVPWAYLFLNNDSLGLTPLAVTLQMQATAKQLAFKNPQFPRIEIPLQLEALQRDTMTFSLWEQVAQLELHITPWAEVYINNEKRALAEGEKNLLLLPGRYNLRFVHTQLGEKTEIVALRAGEVRQLTVNMF